MLELNEEGLSRRGERTRAGVADPDIGNEDGFFGPWRRDDAASACKGCMNGPQQANDLGDTRSR